MNKQGCTSWVLPRRWRKLVTTQFKTRIIWTIDGPAGLSHRAVACFVFSLAMTLEK
jgi:hypothetical protein